MYLKEKQYKIAMILLCPVQGPWASSVFGGGRPVHLSWLFLFSLRQQLHLRWWMPCIIDLVKCPLNRKYTPKEAPFTCMCIYLCPNFGYKYITLKFWVLFSTIEHAFSDFFLILQILVPEIVKKKTFFHRKLYIICFYRKWKFWRGKCFYTILVNMFSLIIWVFSS